MIKRITIATAFVAFLVGCTAQLGYRYADTLIEWQLDDYVSLTDEQQSEVSKLIDQLHRWHAQQELPKYHAALTELRNKLANDDFDESDLAAIEDDVWGFWSNIQQRAANEVERVDMLSFEQRQELVNSLQEKLDEDREEEQEEDEQNPILADIDRVNRIAERLEEWTGGITDEQKQLLREWVDELPEGDFWLDYRQRWADEFAAVMLQENVDTADLRELMVNPRALRTEQHEQYTEQRRQLRYRYLLQIEDQLNAEQRQHLLDKIDEYIALIDDLIQHFTELP